MQKAVEVRKLLREETGRKQPDILLPKKEGDVPAADIKGTGRRLAKTRHVQIDVGGSLAQRRIPPSKKKKALPVCKRPHGGKEEGGGRLLEINLHEEKNRVGEAALVQFVEKRKKPRSRKRKGAVEEKTARRGGTRFLPRADKELVDLGNGARRATKNDRMEEEGEKTWVKGRRRFKEAEVKMLRTKDLPP